MNEINSSELKKVKRKSSGIMSKVLSVLFTILLIGLITGTIVGAAFALYLRSFVDISIDDILLLSTDQDQNTQLYYMDYTDRANRIGEAVLIEDQKLSAGEKITVVNNMGYGNIQDTEYFILDPESPYELPQMLTGSEDSVAYPEAPGKYIAKIPWSYYVWNDPSNPTPEELIGRLSGHMTFYCILVVE